MFLSKDKSGTCLISETKPERATTFWKSNDSKYMVMTKKWADEKFPRLSWEDEPIEIHVEFIF